MLTPGPVSLNFTKPLQAVRSEMPERLIPPTDSGVVITIWYVPAATELTFAPASFVTTKVQSAVR